MADLCIFFVVNIAVVIIIDRNDLQWWSSSALRFPYHHVLATASYSGIAWMASMTLCADLHTAGEIDIEMCVLRKYSHLKDRPQNNPSCEDANCYE